MRDELTRNASINEYVPDSPISLSTSFIVTKNNICFIQVRFIFAMQEFFLSASDNEDVPESPISFPILTNKEL